MKLEKEQLTKKLVTIYLTLMFAIFPVYVHDFYFDITYAKFNFFKNVSILFVVLFFFLKKIDWKECVQMVCTTPFLFYLLFLGVSAISTIFSEYPGDALWGTAGRYNGLMTYLLYGLVFFMLAMEKKAYGKCLYILEGASIPVSILAVLNHFSVDPFGFFTYLDADNSVTFSTTIGNIDAVGEYLAIMVVLSATMFTVIEEKKKTRIFHAGIYLLNIIALVSNRSDSSYVGISLFFIMIPFFMRKKAEVLRYMRLILYFLLVCTFFGSINGYVPFEKEFDGIGLWLILHYHLLLKIGVVLIIIYGAIWLLKIKCGHKHFKIIYGCFLAITFISGMIGLLVINCNKDRFIQSIFFQKFVISDLTGSGRILIWEIALEHFIQLPLFQKLFGMGPDTMLYLYRQHGEELKYFEREFDNPHNYYIQLLLGQGILGLGMWIGWISSSVILLWKKMKENRIYLAVLFGIVAYFLMAAIGIHLVNVSAIAMLLVGLTYCELE